jgi:predicted  nucleic acid-binding Zn ribbon protein
MIITCPHCGHNYRLDRLMVNQLRTQCDKCNKWFIIRVQILPEAE